MEYPEAIDFLYSQLPMYQRDGPSAFKKDLTNTLKLCSFLGNPQNNFKSVHIAGTNGKGSSAHLIASILQEAGYKTGLYTSPHLKNFTERIRVNGKEIEENEVVDFVEKIQPVLPDIQPSFFEITVAMAFYTFSNRKVDFAVIEVGLGGRFDSTNVILPEVSLITNIGFDHESMLGNTLEKIAFEKAGIIKEGVPVIIGTTQEETKPVFERIANERNSVIQFADSLYTNESLKNGNTVCREQFFISDELISEFTEYQLKNLPGVIGVINQLCEEGYQFDLESITKGFENYKVNTGIKGRWQVLKTSPLTITDVGHNEDGIKSIVREINKLDYNKLIVVWGMVSDKDPVKLFKLLPSNARYIFCKPGIPRAMDPEELIAMLSSFSLDYEVVYDVNEAILKAEEIATPDDLIFIGGSTFVVAEIKDL